MDKKVLFVASTAAHIHKFHLPYLGQFKQEGWVIHAACAGAGEDIPDVDVLLDIPFKKRLFSPKNLLASWLLWKNIRKEGYAAIIVHTSLAAFFTRLAVLGRKNRPAVINMVHGYLFDERTSFLKRSLLLAAEKLVAPVTDLLLTMNRNDYEIAKKHRLGRKIVPVMGVGVPFSDLESRCGGDPGQHRRELGIAQEDFVLIYPGEFSVRKMQHIVLHAMTALPENVVLLLPGDGDRLSECRELAQKLGIAHRVRFPGYVTDIVPWYCMADAAVSASRSEGLPFIVMEAMFFGLPVIASDAKGNTDLITDGKTGLLYPRGDWAACARQIRRLMDDPALGPSLSQAAMESIMQYDLTSVQPKIMELYCSTVTDQGKRSRHRR